MPEPDGGTPRTRWTRILLVRPVTAGGLFGLLGNRLDPGTAFRYGGFIAPTAIFVAQRE